MHQDFVVVLGTRSFLLSNALFLPFSEFSTRVKTCSYLLNLPWSQGGLGRVSYINCHRLYQAILGYCGVEYFPNDMNR